MKNTFSGGNTIIVPCLRTIRLKEAFDQCALEGEKTYLKTAPVFVSLFAFVSV